MYISIVRSLFHADVIDRKFMGHADALFGVEGRMTPDGERGNIGTC